MRKKITRDNAMLALAEDRVAAGCDVHELRSDGFEGATDLDVAIDWFNYEYGACSNVFLAELFEFATGDAVIVEGAPDHRYKCHCCELSTLTDPTGYDICPWCGWEDLGPIGVDTGGSPNKTTIAATRIQLAREGRTGCIYRWPGADDQSADDESSDVTTESQTT